MFTRWISNLLGSARRRKSRTAAQPLDLETRVLPAAITVTTTPAARGAVNVRIEGSVLRDVVNLVKNPDSGAYELISDGTTTFRLNRAAASPRITLGTQLNDVRFELGRGDDAVRIENASAASLQITDGLDARELSDYLISTSIGNVSQLGSVTGTFGSGSTVLNLIAEGTLNVGRMTVTGTSLAALGVGIASQGGTLSINGPFNFVSRGSLSQDFVSMSATGGLQGAQGSLLIRGAVSIDSGAQMDRVFVTGNVDFQGGLSIDTGSGDDTVIVTAEQRSSPQLGFLSPKIRGGDLRILTGDGANTVRIESFADREIISIYRNLIIDTGHQNDLVHIGYVDLYGRLDAELGASSVSGDVTSDQLLIDSTWIGIRSSATSLVYTTGAAVVQITGTVLRATDFKSHVEFVLGSGQLTVGVNSPLSSNALRRNHSFRGLSGPVTVFFRGFVLRNPSLMRLLNNARLG